VSSIVQTYEVVIIGGGMAGLTAAIYTARAGRSTVVLDKASCGGLANWAVEVQNFPSHKRISGMALMERVKEQAEAFGAEIQEIKEVLGVDVRSDIKIVETDDDNYQARALIIATGREPIPLPVPADSQRVHYCAICDASLYKRKYVLVVGGGNSGVGEALYLLDQGVGRLTLIEQEDHLFAAQKDIDALRVHNRVRVLTGTEITAVDSGEEEMGITLRNRKTGEREEIQVHGIFVYIGQEPKTEMFRGILEMDGAGYLVTDEEGQTRIAGVFVAGDVRRKKYRQLTTAAGDGTIAALAAEDYLRSPKAP